MPSPAATTVTVQVYLVCSQRVTPVPRTLPGPLTDRLITANALLGELERQPAPVEDRAGFVSEVPGGLAIGGPAAGDSPQTLRLDQDPQELPSYALAQLVCTFAGTAAGDPDQSVVLGGPSNTEPPRRYRCDDELRTAPDAGATAGTKVP